MFTNQDVRCPVCGQILEETEDIVVCPLCAAPHHRICYARTGHCFFERRHATSSGQRTVSAAPGAGNPDPVCPVCGSMVSHNDLFCKRCGENLIQTATNPKNAVSFGFGRDFSSVFDPLAGMNPLERMGEHTVEEWSAFIGPNANYYLARFRALQEGESSDFNYSGAFLHTFWCFFRGMYCPGIVLLLTLIASNLLNTLLTVLWGTEITSYQSMFLGALQIVVFGSIMFISGFFSNRSYQKHCDRQIRRIKQANPADLLETLRTEGGIKIRSAYASFAIYCAVIFMGTMIIGMMVP